jgi:hypothetical protein
MKGKRCVIVAATFAAIAASCGKESPPDSATGTDGESGIVVDGSGSSTAIGADDAVDDTGHKLDVGEGMATGGPGDCNGGGGMMGENTFSIIWIANSPEGTVSKIDTQSGLELARYYSGPTNGNDDPSRTSVNLAGDVAVTNRAGGITKISSSEERCVDANANGSIETSTGPNVVLPWGTDECVLWHVQLPYPDGDNTQGPRPTSWDAGGANDPCQTQDDRVWVGWWERDLNTATFHRLDGGTGQLLDEVVKPNWDLTGSKTYGPYGGATDAEGNFWVTGLGGPLVKIDGVTLELTQWETPPETFSYGMTVDANGHPWSAGLNGEFMHFDPATQNFDVYPTGNGALRGMMIDRENQAWAAGNTPCALVQFDLDSRQVVNANIALEGCNTPVGVSIDIDGYVWVPDQGSNLAFKVHPQTYDLTTTPGLVQPYTYSDMTGAGLGLVTSPPQG